MCPVRQQPALIVERPPYYRLPRNRPVGFEKPSHYCQHVQSANSACCPKVHVYINHEQEHHHQQQDQHQVNNRKGEQAREPEMLANLPSYNNLPKPFCRESNDTKQQLHGYGNGMQANFRQQHDPPTKVPKILINADQSQVYPTSTVHKSMLRSHSSAGSTGSPGDNNVAYTRLISPTLLTTSYEPTTASYEPSSFSRSTNTDSEQHQASSNKCQTNFDCRMQIDASSGRSNREAAGEFLQATLASHQNVKQQNRLPLASTTKVCRQRPAGQQADSNTVLPDSKRDEFMWDRQLERASIAHQSYRTLPIVMPKPKARHDLASGIYMRLNYDPTWDLALSKPAPGGPNVDRKIREAIGVSELNGWDLVHLNNSERTAPLPFAAASSTNCTCVLSQHLCPTCPAHSASGQETDRSSSTGLSPAFNYREYINSTRRAI